MRTETHKYVEYADGEQELYDLRADPYELESFHENVDASLVEDLAARLEALRDCALATGVGRPRTHRSTPSPSAPGDARITCLTKLVDLVLSDQRRPELKEGW